MQAARLAFLRTIIIMMVRVKIQNPECKFRGGISKKETFTYLHEKTMNKDAQLRIKKRKMLISNEEKEEKEEKECSLCETEFLPLCINCETCKTMCEQCYKTKYDYGFMNEWGSSCPYRWGDDLFWDGYCHHCANYTFACSANDASCTFCNFRYCKGCLTEFREVTDSNPRKLYENLQTACPDCMEEFEYVGISKKTEDHCYVKKPTTPTTPT